MVNTIDLLVKKKKIKHQQKLNIEGKKLCRGSKILSVDKLNNLTCDTVFNVLSRRKGVIECGFQAFV